MKHILIIDDDNDMRTILDEVLSLAGYKTTVAAEGNEGLHHFQNSTFDLIITDLIMPGKEGIETIIEVKKVNTETKIIAISGGGRIDAADHLSVASKIGADATLAKPFRNHEILKLVKNTIGLP